MSTLAYPSRDFPGPPSVAVVVPAENEPLALSWEPAPLVVWADPVVVAEDQSDAAAVPSIESPSELEARAA